MRIKWAIGGGGLILLLVAFYSVYWWIGAERLREGAERWAADRRARGWTVSHEPLLIEGYPTRYVLIAHKPVIATPKLADGWRWQSPKLVAIGRPWSPNRLTFHGDRVHRLRRGAGEPREIVVEADRASGVLQREVDARRTGVAIALAGLRIQAAELAQPVTIDSADARIVLPDQPGRADRGAGPEPPGPGIDLKIVGIDLGVSPYPELGRKIELGRLSAKLIGPLPAAAPARALGVWRDGGGTIKIALVSVRWQTVEFRGEGTVALDRDLQPIAALSTQIKGYPLLLDLMVGKGAITPGNAASVKIGLDLLARATSGRRGVIALPLTVQDRRLSVGPITVTQLPRVEWRR